MSIQQQTAPTFGIIADVQYADVDDGHNFSQTRQRYYRNSLNLLKNAVNYWRDCHPKVEFVLQLGDLIDGKNKKEEASKSALKTVMSPFSSLQKPVYHILGNHEFYNFKRDFLLKSALNSSTRVNCKGIKGKAYYTFLASSSLRIVALDCYEISSIGAVDGSEERKEADILLAKNPNEDKNAPSGFGLEGRFTAYNGGVTSAQLDWLGGVLGDADAKKENVIVMGHIPVSPEASKDPSCLCWNYEEMVAVLHRHSCVCAYFAGHEHDGGSCTDEKGIVHITFAAVLETGPGDNAFATATLYCDRIEIFGHGRIQNHSIKLRYPTLIL